MRGHPGWWLLARGVHLPVALLSSFIVIAGFSLIPTVDLPVGIITADTPAVMPLYLIEPPLLAMLLARSCFSAAAPLETSSPRPIRLWHLSALSVTAALTCLGLALQPNVPSADQLRVLIAYLGCVGLLLIGAALAGEIGWIAPAAYLLLLGVIGSSGFGRVAPWAWSMQPITIAAPTAASLLIAGASALLWRWRRHQHTPQD